MFTCVDTFIQVSVFQVVEDEDFKTHLLKAMYESITVGFGARTRTQATNIKMLMIENKCHTSVLVIHFVVCRISFCGHRSRHCLVHKPANIVSKSSKIYL